MIKLSNGHVVKYMAASGALAYGGGGWSWEQPLKWFGFLEPERFTVVSKTVTRHPRVGNFQGWKPWNSVLPITGGMVNKIGLTNPGIKWWCENFGPEIDHQKLSVIGSIFGNRDELVEMSEMLNNFDLMGIEVNVSCPNTEHSIDQARAVIESIEEIRSSRHPIIVKLSVAQDYLTIARELIGIAEAISLNSVPWEMVFPGQRSPLWKLQKRVGGGGGGVSGKPAQPHNWQAVKDLACQGSLPVIGPSVMEFTDIERLRELGAEAVSFGCIHLRKPWKPTSLVKEDIEKEGI